MTKSNTLQTRLKPVSHTLHARRTRLANACRKCRTFHGRYKFQKFLNCSKNLLHDQRVSGVQSYVSGTFDTRYANVTRTLYTFDERCTCKWEKSNASIIFIGSLNILNTFHERLVHASDIVILCDMWQVENYITSQKWAQIEKYFHSIP